MREWFQWLVRHEKLLAIITGALLIALIVQMKSYQTRVEPDANLTSQQAQASPTAPPLSQPERSRTAPAPSSTEGISGTWEMSIHKPKGGIQTWTLTLEQSGEILKGVINSEGGDLPVTGTIKGRSISLSAKRFGVTVEFPATLNGDSMTGEMHALTITRQWTAKRM